MANYVGIARTNYFRVKDLEAFRAALAPLSIEIVSKGHDASPQEGEPVALLSHEEGGWPSSYWDDDTDDVVEVDVTNIIAEHLVDGEVAVGLEVGAEKLRYVIGYGWAVNSKGDVRTVNLESALMEQARELGDTVTEASY